MGSVLGAQKLNRSFDYDPLYRLLTADGRENIPSSNYPWWDDGYRSDDTSTTSAYTQNYAYDKIGNILELAHTAASSPDSFTRTFGYGTTNNQLTGITVATSIGTYTYDYDEVGNQIKENTTRNYEWDHSNNMRSFFNQAGTSEPTIYAQYLYSGGQRVKKLVRTSGGGYESTSYVGGIYEYKTDGTDEQNTLNVQGLATVRTGDNMGDSTPAIKYNLEDNLGSSMTLLDDTGDWVNHEEYYPFGETSFGSYALKRYRFQGKEKDMESGLYYLGARYYCSASCRFIGVDNVVQPVQSSYCGFDNNPIIKTDKEGNLAKVDTEPAKSALKASPARNSSSIGTSGTLGRGQSIPSDQNNNLDDGGNYHTGTNVDLDRIGPRINNFVIKPAENLFNFFVTTPQHVRHTFQQGLFQTPEAEQQVWSTKGWTRQGSPEMDKVNLESQTEAVWGIMLMPVGELASMGISRVFRGAAGSVNKSIIGEGTEGVVETTVSTTEKEIVGETVETVVDKSVGKITQTTSKVTKAAYKDLPGYKNIIHHIASNKHLSKYTPQFEAIVEKYALKLDAEWNKIEISYFYHYSKHPDQYHEFVLRGLIDADMGAKGDPEKFVKLFNEFVVDPLLQNPNILNKTGW